MAEKRRFVANSRWARSSDAAGPNDTSLVGSRPVRVADFGEDDDRPPSAGGDLEGARGTLLRPRADARRIRSEIGRSGLGGRNPFPTRFLIVADGRRTTRFATSPEPPGLHPKCPFELSVNGAFLSCVTTRQTVDKIKKSCGAPRWTLTPVRSEPRRTLQGPMICSVTGYPRESEPSSVGTTKRSAGWRGRRPNGSAGGGLVYLSLLHFFLRVLPRSQ